MLGGMQVLSLKRYNWITLFSLWFVSGICFGSCEYKVRSYFTMFVNKKVVSSACLCLWTLKVVWTFYACIVLLNFSIYYVYCYNYNHYYFLQFFIFLFFLGHSLRPCYFLIYFTWSVFCLLMESILL